MRRVEFWLDTCHTATFYTHYWTIWRRRCTRKRLLKVVLCWALGPKRKFSVEWNAVRPVWRAQRARRLGQLSQRFDVHWNWRRWVHICFCFLILHDAYQYWRKVHSQLFISTARFICFLSCRVQRSFTGETYAETYRYQSDQCNQLWMITAWYITFHLTLYDWTYYLVENELTASEVYKISFKFVVLGMILKFRQYINW